MTPGKPSFRAELEAVEFPTLTGLIARSARTAGAQRTLSAMGPWDGRAGLRRLRQRELLPLWEQERAELRIHPFDEALEQLINPGGWLLPEHWRQLREGLGALGRVIRRLAQLEWPVDEAAEPGTHLGIDPLQVTAAILADPGPIVERLKRGFTEDGQLDPLRIPALAELHRDRQRCFQAVQAKLQKLLRELGDAFQEAVIVERNGRYCLPVRSEKRGQVPGLVLDRSGSGATVFLEPFEAVQINNDHVEADRAYQEAVQAFLRELLDELRQRRPDFQAWHTFQVEVDEVLALLHWKGLCEGLLPALGQERLRLEEARHPLLLEAVRAALELEPLGHEVVALSLDLDHERPGLIISGSNTGGKTVVLKTVGLLAALAHAGCAIPARPGTELPALSSLHADIGDHQTVLGSLSTFSSHILHLKKVLGQARSGGLVLLDELGTGTDPREGAALGIALLQALSKRGCWVLCSTHLGDISQWALRHARFQNASVQFDEARLAPTYRLLVGLPGQSRALTIAAKLGLPAPVLQHAEKVLGRREQDWREFLRQLEGERIRLLEASDELARGQAALEKDQRILAEREARMKAQQEKFLQEAETRLQRTLDFVDHESKRLVKELKEKQRQADKASADRIGTEARERVKLVEDIARRELAAVKPAPAGAPTQERPQPGSWVRHKGFKVEGKLLSLKGERAVIQTAQGRRLEAALSELEPAGRGSGPSRSGSVRVRAEAVEFERELNLIGRASDDVDTEVHRFVEEALAGGLRFIRIVHGHGTGRLKTAVREALKGHPGIAAVEDAVQAQGGAGATVITLR